MNIAEQFRIALITILGLSIIFNCIFVLFTVRKKIGTRLCTILLYCKLYPSKVFYWSLVCMSVYNILCLSIERCVCLCCPFWYRVHKRKLLTAFVVLIAASPFFVEAPYCVATLHLVYRDAGNGTDLKVCMYDFGDIVGEKAIGIAYVVLFWILPFCLIVLLYALIIVRIRRSSSMRDASSGTGGGGGGVSAAAKKLTIITGVTAIAFVLLFAMDSVSFMLKLLDMNVVLSPFFDELDSFLVSMNSALNPLIYLLFMPAFRRFLVCRSSSDGNAGSETNGKEARSQVTGG